MSTIVTRAGKGSALTWTEGDANITNLNTDKMENFTVAGDSGTSQTVSGGNTLTIAGGVGLSSVASATDVVTINLDNTAVTAASYTAANITVDAQGRITAAANGSVSLALDGLSDVVITAAATNDVLVYNGTNWVDTAANTLTVSAASTATTATTATGATNINISTTDGNTSDTTMYPVLVGALSTGNQLPHTDSGISYNASTNALTLGQNGVALGSIIFANSTAGGTTTLGVPANAGTFTFTLPSSNGNTQNLLTTNGAGQTSWASSITGTFTFNNGVANNPKLGIGTGSLSSTAWTTTGIGLRVSAATYTDTSSTAGTVAASHVHAIAASTMASTNAITVTDAASLYVASAPTAGTNTTITNGWAILTAGNIKAGAVTATTFTGALTGNASTATTATSATSATTATKSTNLVGGNGTTLLGSIPYQSATDTTTLLSPNTTTTTKYLKQVGDGTNGFAPMWSAITTLDSVMIGSATPSTGSFTTLAASSTVSGTGFSTYLASPPAIGGTAAAAGTFTTLTSTGRTVIKDLTETIATVTYAATITPDVANGTVQKVTLTGNVTFSAFANPVTGQSLTLIVTQDATGSRTLTSTMKFSGATKTLSTAANSIDIITVFYDGTNYYASLAKGFA